MHDGVRAFGGLVGLDGWKGAEDMGGVLKEDTCHDKDGAKIGVIADDNFRLLFAIHQAKRGENHRQAKSDGEIQEIWAERRLGVCDRALLHKAVQEEMVFALPQC